MCSEADLPAEGAHVPGPEPLRRRQHRPVGPLRQGLLLHTEPGHGGEEKNHETSRQYLK